MAVGGFGCGVATANCIDIWLGLKWGSRGGSSWRAPRGDLKWVWYLTGCRSPAWARAAESRDGGGMLTAHAQLAVEIGSSVCEIGSIYTVDIYSLAIKAVSPDPMHVSFSCFGNCGWRLVMVSHSIMTLHSATPARARPG
jgi:hypothetical protein